MGKLAFVGGGASAPLAYPANFADATWAQIIEACQTNTVPSTWVVGDQKPMTINGTDYPIDIIGKGHDDYADGSGKAPLTFQMHDSYRMTTGMNDSDTNAGGWESSAMRITTLPTIMSMMPGAVQLGIKEVTKLISINGQIKATADKLFFLSEIEIIGETPNSFEGEGKQYAYYAAGNSRVKLCIGVANPWWERSVERLASITFCAVTSEGDSFVGYAGNSYGIAFAFCF